MKDARVRGRPFRAGALGLFLLLTASPAVVADQPPAASPPAAAVAPAISAPVLSLWDCRHIALEKQPTLAAYRASVAFAQARAQALENLCTPSLIRPDLPIRREQAALGVKVAQAQLCQAEWETTYNVTRNYISALYAREQYELAKSAIKQLQDFKDDTDILPPEWIGARAQVYMSLGRGRQQEALQGYNRAVAALREAMGVGPDFCLHLADTGMHRVTPPICREDVLALALSRRGELAQTCLVARVAALEVDAQGLIHLPTAQTFAAGSDIHAQPVAQGLADGTYRPGAIAIEMPTVLAGQRHDRVIQAQALHARAEEVVNKTRNLVALEVEDSFYHWLDTSAAVVDFASAVEKAEKAAKDARDALLGPKSAAPVDVFEARRLTTQSRLEYNTAVYHALLALAALERITAGGFCPGFETAFAPGMAPAPEALPPQVAPVDPGR
jgi:outer membrane protein TolC